MLLEQALQLSARHTHQSRDVFGGQWLTKVGFHQGHGFRQLAVAGANAGRQRRTLTLVVGAQSFKAEVRDERLHQCVTMA